MRLGNDLGVAPADLLAIVGGIAGAVLFVALRRFASPGLGVVVLGAVLAFVIAESAYTWNRLFESSGPSGRALTAATPESVSWVDGQRRRGASGCSPTPSARSGTRARSRGGTSSSGTRASIAPTCSGRTSPTRPRRSRGRGCGSIRGPAASPAASRRTTSCARRSTHACGPAGAAVAASGDLELVDLEVPFRASWMTFGLDPDGWTRPERKAVLRVFGPAGQTAVKASVSSPEVETPRTASVGPASATLGSTQTQELTFEVCVPESGFADVPIRVGRRDDRARDPARAAVQRALPPGRSTPHAHRDCTDRSSLPKLEPVPTLRRVASTPTHAPSPPLEWDTPLFRQALTQFEQALPHADVAPEVAERLRYPERSLVMSVPVSARRREPPRLPRLPRAALQRARPDEGRHPLRRQRHARRVRGARDVDDLEVLAAPAAVRRREGRRALQPARAELRGRAAAAHAPLHDRAAATSSARRRTSRRPTWRRTSRRWRG